MLQVQLQAQAKASCNNNNNNAIAQTPHPKNTKENLFPNHEAQTKPNQQEFPKIK